MKRISIKAIPYKNFVANYPNQQDYYQPVLDALDYQPGLLEKVPNIIITEGKNDFYTLCYINEVLLNNKYKKINKITDDCKNKIIDNKEGKRRKHCQI